MLDGSEDTATKKTTKLSQIEKQSDSGRRLVEYFVVVSSVEYDAAADAAQKNAQGGGDVSFSDWKTESYDDDEEEELQQYKFRPMITARYPLTDHADNPLHDNVAFFCHPSGGIHLRTEEFMPKVHYFVATGGTGKQIYGTCLTLWEPQKLKVKQQPIKQDGTNSAPDNDDDDDVASVEEDGVVVVEERQVYLPKCLVLLSTYPYLAAFREYLTQINQLSKHGEMTLPLERYITNFCAEIPAPPPGSFEVQTTILDSVIKMWSPPHNLPIAWVSLPFSYLFECLDIDNIMLVWHCLVLERQVLITSTQLSLLTQATEIFLSLLFPMRWSHAYIPVLPTFLIPMLSAPMPFLCGINKANLADALYDLSRECVLVDLDKNTVTLGPDTPALPPLPPFQEGMLRAQLEENVGMVFREARSLTKNDDYSDQGTHLPSHVKMMAEAMWESRLCLFDEAFHLMFTPEESRKNLLNGNDSSGMDERESSLIGDNPLQPAAPSSMDKSGRKQSAWDAVQETFLDTFVYLLRNYRKYLIFPSKHNEGSYGGAGFRSKEFIESQRYDMREFLEQLIGTQMFDNFITKRLYGSGEADVAFFDMAVDRFLKNAGLFADVDLGGRLIGGLGSSTSNLAANDKRGNKSGGLGGSSYNRRSSKTVSKVTAKVNDDPLLQSARVHRKLKTIVPPEPTGEGLPAMDSNKAVVYTKETDDGGGGDDQSVHSAASASTRNSQLSSPGRYARVVPGTDTEKSIRYVYGTFPSKLDPDYFGKPRPLPAAVIAEFDRQRKDAAQFRRKGHGRTASVASKDKKSHFQRAHSATDPVVPPSPEASTFTVFFMAFTALVGKELVEIAHDPSSTVEDRTILSTYVPTGTYATDTDTESEAFTDAASEQEDEEDFVDAVDEEEKADIDRMKANRPAMFFDDSETGSVGELGGGMTSVVDEEKKSASSPEDKKGVVKIVKGLEVIDLMGVPEPDDDREPPKRSPSGKAVDPLQGDFDNSVTKETTGLSDDNTEAKTTKTEDSAPRNRFRDKLSDLQIEEAKATGRAQLGLAFEVLTMMKKRGLRADPEAYQSLIDACGRVGDTKRATDLLAKMHEDGIVADGTVYACLVSAFSADSAWKDTNKEEELPEWANSTAVEMDWNKLQKRTFLDRLVGQVVDLDDDEEDDDNDANLTTYQKLRKRLQKSRQSKDGASGSGNKVEDKKMDFFVTEAVERQIALGENLLEIVFPDISIDTEDEVCPRCNFLLSDEHVVEGWTLGDHNDYTTACPNCTQRFVPHFCVQSSSESFLGSKGRASPLLCERLSPWVLQKEIRSVMSDVEGINNLLDPKWREKEYKNAVLWWNLVLSCMRYRFPFTFLLQGSFEQNLIAPMPEDDA